MKRLSILVATILIALSTTASAATFEDLALANEQIYAGPGGGRYWAGAEPPANNSVDTPFVSGGITFGNTTTDFGGFSAWRGFAYSNTTDTTTPGFGNQYSAIAGGGAGGSENYGVAYAGGGGLPRIDLAEPTVLASAAITNTSYAALSMLNGDAFAKKFGGVSGNDPDWFLLTIVGLDAADAITGTLDVYLADYRFADNSLDYILDTWSAVELKSLGAVSALEFTMNSSDTGSFGPNTPLYFAIDNVQPVPLPAAAWLFVSACGFVATRRRHRGRYCGIRIG